jgi:HK97 gp10 family phage protein
MADGITTEIVGLKELYWKLAELDARVAKKHARKSSRAGGYAIRDKAKQIASSQGLDFKGTMFGIKSKKAYQRTGRIPKNIVMSSKKPKNGIYTSAVRYRTLTKGQQQHESQIKEDKKNAWYARFVEFGAPAKGITPKPFLRPALQASEKTAVEAARESLVRDMMLDVTELGKK